MATRRFRNAPQSVPAARRFVRDVLGKQPREIVEAAELMTSELVTNSVRHAHTGFELTIHTQGHIRVEVRDTGAGRPMLQDPTPQDPSGRGLRIVEAMSNSWGIIPQAEGKTVWFTLSQAAAAGEHPTVAASDRPRSAQPGPTGYRPWLDRIRGRTRWLTAGESDPAVTF